MARAKAELKGLVKKAVKVKQNHPTLSIPAAMRVAKFTNEEAEDRTLQMRVRRMVSPPTKQIDIAKSPSSSTVSTLTSPAPIQLRPIKKLRLSSTQAQQKHINDLALQVNCSSAHKRATKLYAEQLEKGEDEKRLSASKVSELVYGEFGVLIHKRTIQPEVAAGRIGVSLLKPGEKGNFPALTFQHLANAFESFIKIKQLNGQGGDICNNKLIQLLKRCTKPALDCDPGWLLKRLLKKTATELSCGKVNNAEERRVRWTTYFNIKSWFDNWDNDLVKLGFASRDDNDNIVIPDEQLKRILNIDETCLVMDGSKCNRGGQPEVTFYSHNLPNLGKSTIKSSVSTTMIAGSTAAGEAIPPHFQFSTTSKSEETQRIHVNHSFQKYKDSLVPVI